MRYMFQFLKKRQFIKQLFLQQKITINHLIRRTRMNDILVEKKLSRLYLTETIMHEYKTPN